MRVPFAPGCIQEMRMNAADLASANDKVVAELAVPLREGNPKHTLSGGSHTEGAALGRRPDFGVFMGPDGPPVAFESGTEPQKSPY